MKLIIRRPLLQTADPPPLLYLHGRREMLAKPALAVVGSRSRQRRVATRLGVCPRTEPGRADHRVGAGGRGGRCGAQGALQGQGGTIAVLGTGLDQVYPKRHAALAREVVLNGLLISEYSLGMPPLPPNSRAATASLRPVRRLLGR